MADLVVHDLKAETVEFLTRRARHHGRSVEEEARQVLDDLESRERSERAEFREWAAEFRRSLEGRHHTEGSELRRIGLDE